MIMRGINVKKSFIVYLLFFTILISGCNQENEVEHDKHDEKNDDIEEKVIETELPSETLQKGDEHEHVLNLQQALIELGYPIEKSGVYDDLTTWAITDIQLQHEQLLASGIYNEQVREVMKQAMDGDDDIVVASHLNKPTHPEEFYELVENPFEILVLVNKNYALPSDFEPNDLVVPDVRFPFEEDDPKKQLRKEAAHALEELFSAAENEGHMLFAQSGYRSFDRQEAIFASNVERHGEEQANTYSAKAGESEHQTGLVMDITSETVDFQLITEFGETPEGMWVQNNAHKYGFIIRYPQEKESITEYQYEPWHLRYVGKKAAKEIAVNNVTLEEYLGVTN